MRVLQILPELNHGGVELCVVENSETLIKAGHESYIISSGGRLVEKLVAQGAAHYTLPIAAKRLATLLQVKPLRKIIQTINPDVIHIHSRLQAWLCYFALKKIPNRSEIKVITNVHGFNSVNFYSKKMLWGEAVVLDSYALKKYVMKHYPDVPSDKMHAIPLGVDTQRFNQNVQENSEIEARLLQLDSDFKTAKIIMLPGRLSRIKGHEIFIELMKRLKIANINVKGLIVGGIDPSQKYYQLLKQKIEDEGLTHDLYFFGNCDDINALYNKVCELMVNHSLLPEITESIVVAQGKLLDLYNYIAEK